MTWHDHKHRLWDDFVRAMGSLTLSENDWQAYLLSHDLDELPEVAAEIDRIKDLLKPETVPIPDLRRKRKKKKT